MWYANTIFEESITWNIVPNRNKNLNYLDKFKQIKMWKPTACTCKLCTGAWPGIF